LQDYLAKQGVEPIEALGVEFDPNFHEAVLRIEDSEHPDNTVVEEVQRGYRMGDRVLRPSMVKVARSA
jgi:molecular chaperone GrpE